MDPQIEALRSKTRSLINETREAVVRIRDYTEVVNLVLQQFKIHNIKFKPPQSELELKVMELLSNRLLYGPPTGVVPGGSRNGVVPGGSRNDVVPGGSRNDVVPGGSRNNVVGCNGSLVLGIVILSIALLVSYLLGE